MKILLISNMFPTEEYPSYGIFVKNFIIGLERYNYKIKRCVIEGRGKGLFSKIKKYYTFFKEVYIGIMKCDYDVVYVHYINHSLIPLIFLRKYIKRPLILNAHGSDIFVNNYIGLIIQKLVIKVIKSADLIVVPSLYFQNIVANKFQFDKDRIFISPSSGINRQIFRKTYDTNIKNKRFCIGFISRIDEGKGWDIFIKAIYILKNKGFLFSTMIIGGGSQVARMEEMIHNLDLKNEIQYYKAKPQNELVDFYNKMNVFIFPTTRQAESLGLVGIEAMACGVPVIGSNIAELPEYIHDGINGKLFRVGDFEELSRYIEYFMNIDVETYSYYCRNALDTARQFEDKIVFERLNNKLLEVYEYCNN